MLKVKDSLNNPGILLQAKNPKGRKGLLTYGCHKDTVTLIYMPSVDEFIYNLPNEEQRLVTYLRRFCSAWPKEMRGATWILLRQSIIRARGIQALDGRKQVSIMGISSLQQVREEYCVKLYLKLVARSFKTRT